MGEEKRNRIVAAITVNAILLVFIILAVLIAQIVQINVLKRRKRELFAELEYISSLYDTYDDILLDLENRGRAYEVAMQLYEMGSSWDEIMRALLGDDYDKYETPVLAVVIE